MRGLWIVTIAAIAVLGGGLWLTRSGASGEPPAAPAPANLVKNPLFKTAGSDPQLPADYVLQGAVAWSATGTKNEFADLGVALLSGKEADAEGFVAQDVTGFDLTKGKWFRFSVRGLPDEGFAVKNDNLYLKVEFFGKKGTDPLDGVTRKIYALVERARSDLAVNGIRRKNGAEVWKTYALDFKVPFNEVDQLRLIAGFRNGCGADKNAGFYLTEFTLTPIPDPAERKTVKTDKGIEPDVAKLTHLGGHWYYQADKPDAARPDKLTITAENANRLFYKDTHLTNPLAENMSAWLRKGYKDLQGRVVAEDRFLTDNVTVRFEDGKTMIVHTKNLPNHPTAQFPEERGGRPGNPSYIQEHDYTYYLPLEPKRNPNAVAMNKTNSNRGLPMGTIGIAINGVAFYNPFDAGMEDATDLMDRCCGHPSPDNRYHYHKYPVCVKSPFVDEGEEHSPLIGWALDGFPIYGPYESKGVMAKDCKDNPLNEFNIHFDEVHGWHYHVTPGKYPYVIGGFWGEVDPRNVRGPGRRPPPE